MAVNADQPSRSYGSSRQLPDRDWIAEESLNINNTECIEGGLQF